jgi:lysozyme
MNSHLKLSPAGANLIKHFEGCLQPHQGKVKAYRCPAGVTTIGWGHTNHHTPKFDLTSVWSQEQCDEVFLKDMEVFEKRVRSLVKIPLEQWQYDALVSFDYNTGALHKSTLLKKVNSQDHKGAASEFKRWNKADGKELAGLTRRRASESLLYQHITDENYDGVADKPRASDHPMAQAVDSPED